MGQTTEKKAEQTLKRLNRPRFAAAHLAAPLAILIPIALCIIISALIQDLNQRSSSTLPNHVVRMPNLISLPNHVLGQAAFLSIEAGSNARPDLFLYTGVLSPTRKNLTQTPTVTETYPVLDHKGNVVAYYGTEGFVNHVYVLELPNGLPRSLTSHSGTSGVNSAYQIVLTAPLTFSPDDEWVAFSVSGAISNSLELAIVRSDATQVLNVTTLGHPIIDFAWLDNTTLIILAQLPDGSQQKWLGYIEPPNLRLESFTTP
jgi:hypothetical protein